MTSGWPTYENQKFGFRIKFPPTFTYLVPGGLPYRDLLFHMFFFDAQYAPKIGSVGPYFFPALSVTVLANPDRFSVDQFFRAHLAPRPDYFGVGDEVYYWPPETLCATEVSGKRALRLTDRPKDVDVPPSLKRTGLLVPRDSSVLDVAFQEVPPLHDPTFDLMTSTFELMR